MPGPLNRRRLLFASAAACCFAALPPMISWVRRSRSSTIADQATMADTPATIALGDPKNFDLRAPGAGVDRQPVGMHFYERKWPMKALGSVRYLQGRRSFDIPWVSGVMGSSDPERPEQGIYSWDVTAFAMQEPRVSHELARNRLFGMFRAMLMVGWRPFVEVGDPRLFGAQAVRYLLQDGGLVYLDGSYLPTMEQWMKLNEHLPYWCFWADGVYLSVQVVDEPALRDPAVEGVYMFSITLESEAPHFWPYFDKVEDMRRWKELVPAELARVAATRPGKEAALRRQGYVIDENYRDPPILALGQVQGS